MTKTIKEHYIPFVADNVYFRRLNELAGKLGVNRSECIRLMLDLGFKEYLDQKGPLLIVNDEKWNEMMEARVQDVKFNKTLQRGLELFFSKDFLNKSPEEWAAFTEFLKVAASKINPTGAKVQPGMIEMSTDEFQSFFKTCMGEVLTDYNSFSTEDSDPTKQMIRESIKRGIGRAKGKVF